MRFTSGMIVGMLALGTQPVWAAANLVLNGDFEQTSGALLSGSTAVSGGITPTDLPNWTAPANSLDVLFTPGTADTSGASAGSNGTVKLWGPGDGSNNGLTATSPTGGNFVAVDADSTYGRPLQQTIAGLQQGGVYQLTFYWAAGQETGNYGATTESWSVSLGAQTQSTGFISTPSQGFSPWRQATMLFEASSASALLSFMAVGTPAGVPPISLLDGVSLVNVPEPASWVGLALGLLGLGFLVRRRGVLAPVSAH